MSRTSAQEPDYQMFAPISKVDVEQRMVFGYASTETEDRQGEIVRHSAVKAALPGYMLWKNVREMHQPSAVGKAVEAEMDEKGLWFGAHIVDDRAWDKVMKKVYQGFSIGGRVTARDPNNKKIITGVDITEISIVDRPANPEATFAFAKRAGDHLLMQPVQKWDCGHPNHQHITKLEAATCMADHQELMKASFDRAADVDTLAKMNPNHLPAGSPGGKGGEFAPKDGGDGYENHTLSEEDSAKLTRDSNETKEQADQYDQLAQRHERRAREYGALNGPENDRERETMANHEKAARYSQIASDNYRSSSEAFAAGKEGRGEHFRDRAERAADLADSYSDAAWGMEKGEVGGRLAKMNPNHHPKGAPDGKGGEFAPKDGGAGGRKYEVVEQDDGDGKPYWFVQNARTKHQVGAIHYSKAAADAAHAKLNPKADDGTGKAKAKDGTDFKAKTGGEDNFADHQEAVRRLNQRSQMARAAKGRDDRGGSSLWAESARNMARARQRNASRLRRTGGAANMAAAERLDREAMDFLRQAQRYESEGRMRKADEILARAQSLRKYNDNHHPAGDEKGGEFAPKDGGESATDSEEKPESSMATKAGEEGQRKREQDAQYQAKEDQMKSSAANGQDNEPSSADKKPSDDEGSTIDGAGGVRAKSSEDIVAEQTKGSGQDNDKLTAIGRIEGDGRSTGSEGGAPKRTPGGFKIPPKPDTSDRAGKDFDYHEGKESFHLEAASKEKDPAKRRAHEAAADAHAEAKNYYESAAKNKKSGKAGHAAGDADAGNQKGAAANKLSEALEKGDRIGTLHAMAECRLAKYNKNHWPAGSPGGIGGRFAPADGRGSGGGSAVPPDVTKLRDDMVKELRGVPGTRRIYEDEEIDPLAFGNTGVNQWHAGEYTFGVKNIGKWSSDDDDALPTAATAAQVASRLAVVQAKYPQYTINHRAGEKGYFEFKVRPRGTPDRSAAPRQRQATQNADGSVSIPIDPARYPALAREAFRGRTRQR